MYSKNILHTIINYSFYAIISLIPIFFTKNTFLFDAYILPKQVLFHVLLSVCLVSLILQQHPKSEFLNFFKKNKKIITPLLILFTSILISSLLSINTYLSFWGSGVREQGLYSYLFYSIFFLLLLFAIKCQAQIKSILVSIYASSAIVCLLAVFQKYNLLNNFFGGRLESSLGQPNFFAHFLAIVLPISIYGLFTTKKRSSTALLLIIVILELYCLLLTYSRAAWLAIIITSVSYALFALIRLRIKKAKAKPKPLRHGLLIIFALIAFLFISFYSNSYYLVRFKSTFDTNSGSNFYRIHYWKTSVAEYTNFPPLKKLFGLGPDTQGLLFASHARPYLAKYETLNTFPGRAHNLFLDILLQFGLVGLFSFSALVFIVIKKALRFVGDNPERNQAHLVIALLFSLLAYFINNLFSFSLVVSSIYFFLILALLARIPSINSHLQVPKTSPETKTTLSTSPINLAIHSILILVIMSAIYIYDIKPLIASHYRIRADIAHHSNNCAILGENYQRAMHYNSKNIFYKSDYVYEAANCLGVYKEKSQIEKVSNNILKSINSINSKHHTPKTIYQIAGAYSMLGAVYDKKYFALAEDNYKELIKINPHLTQGYRDLGRLKIWQGDCKSALSYLFHARSIVPNPSDPQLTNNDHKKSIQDELDRINKHIKICE